MTTTTIDVTVSVRATRDGLVHEIGRPAVWLSGALAVITVLAALTPLGARDAMRGPAAMVGSMQGTAIVLLAVTVPLLVVSMIAVSRGRGAWLIGWLGALGSIAYQAVLFLFAVPFNAFFHLYVAMLSLAIWSIIALLGPLPVDRAAARIGAHAPVRLVAGYVLVNAALFLLLWLQATVPAALDPGAPAFLEGTGMTTGTVQVIDLTFTLPLMALAAVLLLRRRPWGYLLTGALLVMLAIESASIGLDQWVGHAADAASPAVSDALTPAFAVLTVVGLAALGLFLRPGPRRG
jgi:uncharacterized protein (TIGR03382 family)